MMGGLAVVGSTVVDSHASSCLCLDALSKNIKNGGDFALRRNSIKRKTRANRPGSLELGSSFVDSWRDWRPSSRASCSNIVNKSSRKLKKNRRLVIVNELAGQYDDSFDDVKMQIVNYFTYKAVRTVLNQLYEMNPTKYRWFYDFVATNKPGDGKRFLQMLVKEKQDLAERVMVTRLHLYGKWVKKCNHAEIYQEISEENLELMRERLMQTVIWPSDDSSTEKIG